jgi:Flp pilus assembly protein TadB
MVTTGNASTPAQPARRVTVTSPQTDAAQSARPRRQRRDELADQTELGDVLIRSLIRAQLGLALRVLAVFVVLLGGLPLLFAVVPSAATVEIGGLPAPWFLLGLAAFPLLVLLGMVYARQAERNEREFAELVER